MGSLVMASAQGELWARPPWGPGVKWVCSRSRPAARQVAASSRRRASGLAEGAGWPGRPWGARAQQEPGGVVECLAGLAAGLAPRAARGRGAGRLAGERGGGVLQVAAQQDDHALQAAGHLLHIPAARRWQARLAGEVLVRGVEELAEGGPPGHGAGLVSRSWMRVAQAAASWQAYSSPRRAACAVQRRQVAHDGNRTVGRKEDSFYVVGPRKSELVLRTHPLALVAEQGFGVLAEQRFDVCSHEHEPTGGRATVPGPNVIPMSRARQGRSGQAGSARGRLPGSARRQAGPGGFGFGFGCGYGAPAIALIARSIAASSTSWCVTKRTIRGAIVPASTPWPSRYAISAPGSSWAKITMFVWIAAGSSPLPASARPRPLQALVPFDGLRPTDRSSS